MNNTNINNNNNTFIDTSFFTKLSSLKLNELKLSKEAIPIKAQINVRPHQSLSISLNDRSFITDENIEGGFINGEVINVNSLDEFKSINKRQLLQSWGDQLIESFNRGEGDVSNIGFIGILMFADLKKYKYYYWSCYPTFHPKYQLERISDKDKDNEHAIEESQYRGNQFEIIREGVIVMFEFSDGLSSSLNNLITLLGLDPLCTSFELIVKKPWIEERYLVTIKKSQELPPLLTGWERTLNGKLGPKVIDLSSLINPHELSKQARDLNLKLMKWRLAPNLNLDIIKEQRYLLLGSGTLGTYVGRLLLAWGVNNITFVDNGKVSFSNPVRQPLFEFEDCLNGGKDKSKACEDNLKRVYPNATIRGVQMEVPMIGHPITDQTQVNYERLIELINDHDIIYLLMDSSESRWLPTAICQKLNKLVINIALGFDSFLVMRHGCSKNGLGCYYCSNVNAPGDSSIDKSLDQMCTVTKPGLAPIASGVAVELMVNILQSGEGIECKHDDGNYPQQIRGFLNQWRFNKYHCERFSHCVGCSEGVIERIMNWDSVRELLEGDGQLEIISGLANLLENVDIDDEYNFNYEDGDEGEDDEEGNGLE